MSRPFSPNLDNTQFALELEKDLVSSSPQKNPRVPRKEEAEDELAGLLGPDGTRVSASPTPARPRLTPSPVVPPNADSFDVSMPFSPPSRAINPMVQNSPFQRTSLDTRTLIRSSSGTNTNGTSPTEPQLSVEVPSTPTREVLLSRQLEYGSPLKNRAGAPVRRVPEDPEPLFIGSA